MNYFSDTLSNKRILEGDFEMKLKLVELIQVGQAAKNILNKELPVKTADRFSKFVDFLNANLVQAENKRIELVRKYGNQIEDDQKQSKMEVQEENKPKFKEELDQMLATEVEFDFEPVSLNELGDIAISPTQLHLLKQKELVTD
jgi:hypothetical protein